MTAGSALEAADDGGSVDGSMGGAVFGVAESLAAVGVEEVGRGQVAGADGGVGLEGDIDQAELQQAGPTGPARGSAGGVAERCGTRVVGVGRVASAIG